MLELNKEYKIRVSAGSNVLTYTCRILEFDDLSIKVKDNHQNIINISWSAIIYFEEVRP